MSPKRSSTVAKLVYITNGMASTLNSSFELSRRLVAAGHEVTYLSHLDLSKSVESEGHRFIQLTVCKQLRQQLSDRIKSTRPVNPPKKLWEVIKFGRELRRESTKNSEIEDVVQQLNPQLLIIDIEMHYAVLACLNSGIPIVLPLVWFSIFRSPGLPPMHTQLRPARTTFQRVNMRLHWWKLLVGRYFSRQFGKLRPTRLKQLFRPIAYDTNQLDDLRAVARTKEVDFKSQTDWTQWLRPHLYPALSVLCLNAWEMEFPHEPPSKLRYVGPMVDEHRHEAQVDQNTLRDWKDFREQCNANGQPISYCSLGTFWSADTTFLKKVIEVYKSRPEWALVIGLGGKLQSDDLPSVPDNVLVMSYAPQIEVLKSADVAITHGGITTINECINFEVPMLVCSTGHVDQDGCSARVEFHRMGLSADIKSATPKQLEHKIAQLLSDETIREKVVQMKKCFDRYRDDRTAELQIESLIQEYQVDVV